MATVCWAQVYDMIYREVILICNDQFIIGAAQDCDLVVPCVSRYHCYIERHEDSIKLYNTSSTGTRINRDEILQIGQCKEIRDGSIFHLITDENKAVSFIFRLQIYTSGFRIADYVSNVVDCPKGNLKHRNGHQLESRNNLHTKQGVALVEKNKGRSDKDDEIQKGVMCSICLMVLHVSISLMPCLHTFCLKCWNQWKKIKNSCPECRAIVYDFGRNEHINYLVELYLKKHPEHKREDEKEELTVDNQSVAGKILPRGETQDSDMIRRCDRCGGLLPLSILLPILRFHLPNERSNQVVNTLMEQSRQTGNIPMEINNQAGDLSVEQPGRSMNNFHPDTL